MTDDQISDAVRLAIELEEKGQIKEAYFAFTSSSEKAIQALNEIKFVHSSIISSPKHYASLLTSIRTSLSHIENIIENHSPATYNPIIKQPTGEKASRPPLPPKPSRIQKPIIPPKPRTSRPTSPTNIVSNLKPESDLQDNSQETARIRPRVYENEVRPSSLPPPRQPLPIPSARPQTDYQTISLTIIAQGEIDPNYLVPAQTNGGDSLTPSSSMMNNDHIPLIPAPPLLTSHRILQAKVDELDEKIKACRARKLAIGQGQQDSLTEESLELMIDEYTRVMTEFKADLNSVRTIYMSAATIPSILQFGAHIMAYQITLIEVAIFDAIPPLALLEHSSKRPHPRIVASTDFFNYLTRCIEHSVLLPQEASSRAQLIHYWIKVASRCFDINNYQTLKAIISALSTPPVQRLKRTWAYIPKKSSAKLESLNELMSEHNNYGLYREHMGMVSTAGKGVLDEHYARPTVPFLGTFIHDITYLTAACKDKWIQLEDEPRIKEVLSTVERFQKGPRYSPHLPTAFLKSKHHFRPSLSNALHRGASRIQRFSGSTLFGDPEDEEDINTVEQQKMATQYILMRPWVSQNTVDELSHLREPAKTSLNAARSSSMNRNSSVFSSGSSNLRFSTGSMSLQTTESRPTSVDDDEPEELQPPVVPPRPLPKPPVHDELRAALAQRLAKVSSEKKIVG